MTGRPANVEPSSPDLDARPVVELPRAGVPAAAIAIVAALAAASLFVLAVTQRAPAGVRTSSTELGTFAPPPPLTVPPEPVTPPTVIVAPAPVRPFAPPPVRVAPSPRVRPLFPAPLPAPLAIAPSPVVAPPERPAPTLTDPALVIDAGIKLGNEPVSAPGASGTARTPAQTAAAAASGGEDAPARATVMTNRTTVVVAGTMIPAVLETPVDTARPGLLRAIISEDTRGFDAQKLLIPRGSRLIGEYQSDARSGQNRVLVNWTRLIRPDGVAIRLGSPAADPLGGAGIPGRVHSYFLQRFAGAVLQSALAVGVNLASRPANGTVVVGLSGGGVSNVVGQGLLPSNDLRPKITVRQGARLNVFVARDLDFAGTPSVR